MSSQENVGSPTLKRRNNESPVWDHFIKCTDGCSKCTRCDKKYGTDTSTSTLARHLDIMHNIKTKIVKTFQPTSKKEKVIHDKETNDVITDALLDWMIDDLKAFSMVENLKFKKYISILDESYVVPVRQTISNRVELAFENKLEAIKSCFKTRVGKVNLTCDKWTSVANDSYLVMTCHFQEKLVKRNIILDFVPLEFEQDHEIIYGHLIEIMQKFSLLTKVLSITTDNESTMVAAIAKVLDHVVNKYKQTIYHISCGAHVLNLLVQIAFNSPAFQESISAVRAACKSIRASSKLTQKLKAVCVSIGEPDIKVILDCEIRWNSTYDMLQTAIKMENSLTTLSFQTAKMVNVETDDWKKTKQVVEILESFKKATDELCGDVASNVSSLYSCFSAVRDNLHDFEKSPKFLAYKREIQEMLKKFDDYWVLIRPFAVLANGLDPRFKLTIMNRADKEFFSDELDKLYDLYSSNSNEDSDVDASAPKSLTEQFLAKKKLLANGKTEIENYLSTAKASFKTNPVNWWMENSADFPVLSSIAFEFLSAEPTSTSSERAFSLAGQVITNDRSSLLAEKASKLVLLWSWNKNEWLNGISS